MKNQIIPSKVFLMCKCGAYLVGSFARYLALSGVDELFGDYDLIVPPEKWYAVSLLLPTTARLNKHGGLKFKDEEDNCIDVWPCSVEQHLVQCGSGLRDQQYVVDFVGSRVFTSYAIGAK